MYKYERVKNAYGSRLLTISPNRAGGVEYGRAQSCFKFVTEEYGCDKGLLEDDFIRNTAAFNLNVSSSGTMYCRTDLYLMSNFLTGITKRLLTAVKIVKKVKMSCLSQCGGMFTHIRT